jgi:hypothetical protein
MPLDDTRVLASEPTYPNIIPQDNLRLPDALTIKHGPARLLARAVIEGDQAARRMGLRLRLRTDFEALAEHNRREVAASTVLPMPDACNPKKTELTPENGFWLSGENEQGEIVVTHAYRIHNWIGTSLAEQIRACWYGQDLGQECTVTAEAAAMITGVVACAAAAWVRPDFRGKHLSHLMPRIGKAYACARWPIEWAIGFITRRNAEKGLAGNFGQQHLSYSVTYTDGPASGEFVLVYTPVTEVYADLAKFLSGSLSDRTGTGWSADLSGISRAQEVTKVSLDGVFQGSSSLS